LDVLTSEQATELMTRRLGARRVGHEPAAADDIAAHCGRLPLALAIATANAAVQPAVPLAAIAQQLRAAQHGLGAFRIGGDTADMAAVFSWSYNTLSTAAAALFRVLGSHPVPEVSLAAAASLAGLSRGRTRDLLTELARASLITESTDGRFTAHDLLRAFAQQKLRTADPAAGSHEAMRRLLDHYLHSAHRAALLFQPGRRPLAVSDTRPGVTVAEIPDRQAALRWLQTEHDALIAVTVQAGEWNLDTHAWQLAWCLSEYLNARSRWSDWSRAQQAAVRAAARLGDRSAMAVAHRGLGQALMAARHYGDAETQLELAQSLFAQIGDRRGEALTLSAMADLCGRQGRHHDGLIIVQRTLEIHQECGNILGRAQSLNNLGEKYVHLGRYADALAPCSEALAVFSGRGEVHGMAAVHDTLGHAQFQLGDLEKSRWHFERALQLDRDTGRRSYEADTLIRLSEVHLASHNEKSAVKTLAQALDILQDLGHPSAPAVAEKLRILMSA
jgi:tetratricopeptide (TPR) repeat protein